MSDLPEDVLERHIAKLEADNARLRDVLHRYIDHMRPYMEDKDCLVCKAAEAALSGHSETP
mgnify:CR=1 FL=1